MNDVVTIDGFGPAYRIVNPGPGRVGSKLVHGEPYEKKLLVDVQSLGLTGTAFDIGAHIGNHSLFLAAACGLKVHAWEPYDQSRAILEGNVALNPDLDIEVHDWGCGDSDNRGRFTSGMWIEFDPTRDGAKMALDRGHVQVHRIDDHVDVPDLAVIKVDVEGMEAAALAGAVRHIERSHPVIYAESHSKRASRRVAEVLEPLGYRMDKRIQMGSVMERWQT